MVSTRAFIVVATCIYLRRIAEGKRANPVASTPAPEDDEEVDSDLTGEKATLMEWVDLRGTDATSDFSNGEVSETAIAVAFPFSKDSILLRNATVCSIIPSDEPPTDENVPTYADIAKSILDNFWQDPALGSDLISTIDIDGEGCSGGEEWDAWTGVMRLRTPAPTPTSAVVMALPTLVTPSLSASTESHYAVASALRSATSTLGNIFNWTCGVAHQKRAQSVEAYSLRTVTRTALSRTSYTQVEDDVEGEIPPVTSTQPKPPAIAMAAQMIGLNPPRRAGGWMRVDADYLV